MLVCCAGLVLLDGRWLVCGLDVVVNLVVRCYLGRVCSLCVLVARFGGGGIYV